MILIVRENDKIILGKYEAWASGSYEEALKEIERSGHKYIREEITFSGNMVIWVA